MSFKLEVASTSKTVLHTKESHLSWAEIYNRYRVLHKREA